MTKRCAIDHHRAIMTMSKEVGRNIVLFPNLAAVAAVCIRTKHEMTLSQIKTTTGKLDK